MNCECKPPQLAVLRTVQKAGANQGKEFFTCPNSSCKFFAWAGGPMPASLHRPAATSVSVGGGGGGGSAAGRSRSFSHFAKVSILSFDFSPTTATTTAAASSSSSSIKAKSSTETGQVVKITCGITTAGNTKLTNYLTSLSTTEMITFFNPSLKLWCFDIQSHNRIISDIKTMEIPSFDIEELPSFLVHGLLNFVNRIRNLKNIYSEDLDIVPNITTSLLTTLMPFQLDGLKFVIQRGGRALIGDEMGCGKTMQAIGLLQHYRNHWPALLIVPVNLVNQWKQEILQYSSELIQLHDICIIKTKKDQITSKKICIIPYTMIDSFQEQDKLTCDQFGMIICDESHNIKSMDAKRTHCVLPLLRACTIAICLSGTPAVNRPVELYTQLNGLLPSVFAAYDQFTKRYCDAKPARYNAAILDVKGSSNESELRLLLENMVMIRRLKADVVKSLPKKSRELRYVEPDATFLPELRRLDNQMKTTEKKLLEASHDSAEMMKLKRDSQQLLLQFYQITGMCKIKAIQKELFHRINEARLARATEDSMPAETNPSSSSSSASPSKASLAVMELEDDVVMQTQTIHHEVHASDVAHHTRDDAPRVMHLEQDMVLESTPPLTVEMAATILSHASLEYKRKKIDPAVEEEDALVDTDEEAAEEAMFNEHQKRKALLRGGSKVKGKREVDSKRVTRKTSAQNNKDHYFEESEGSVYADDDEEEEEDEYGDYEEEEDEEFEEEDVKGKRKSSSSRSNKRRSIGKQSSAKTKKQKSPVDDDVDEDDIIIFEDEELKKQSKDKVVTAAKSLGQKILVFAHHHKVLDAIEEVLRTSEVGYIRVDGSTSQSRKTALIDEFKTQANVSLVYI